MTAPGHPDATRIVVGVDGSRSSLHALAWAARQAELTHGRLDVVATWQWPQSYGWAVPTPDDYDPETALRREIEPGVDAVRAEYPAVELVIRVIDGHPAPVLVEASKGAELLVVGSRGHGEFVGMLIGSVSEYCAAHAHCPVLVHRATS
jgi:nucleotide-binding universal stress UspA family protein